MKEEFFTVHLSRKDLQKALDAFPNADRITLGIESKQSEWEKVLWADNLEHGDKREVCIINMNPEDGYSEIKTKHSAIVFAQNYQSWQAEQNLSLAELVLWNEVMNFLATEFDLVEEFTENGIL